MDDIRVEVTVCIGDEWRITGVIREGRWRVERFGTTIDCPEGRVPQHYEELFMTALILAREAEEKAQRHWEDDDW